MSSISLINAAKVIKKQLVLFFFSDYFSKYFSVKLSGSLFYARPCLKIGERTILSFWIKGLTDVVGFHKVGYAIAKDIVRPLISVG